MYIITTRAVIGILQKSLKYQTKHKLNDGSTFIMLLVMMDLDVPEKIFSKEAFCGRIVFIR